MQCNPNYYIQLNIHHPSLDSPVWLEFTQWQSKNLDEDKILNKIEEVQQSKKEFLLTDGPTELDFFHVKYPEGSSGSKLNTYTWTKKIFRNQSELSSRLTTLRIPSYCCCALPCPKSPKFSTRSGRRNGCE
jgi:hypothetical protein